MKNITFKIYAAVETLPQNWDLVASSNHFLQTPYLQALQNSAPLNMQCFYIGVFEKENLIGVALSQYLDLNKLESFGERDSCFKTYVRNFIFRNFASHVLFLGNNMITGQNGFTFSKNINFNDLSTLLIDCSNEIISYFKVNGVKIHIVSFKDFYKECANELVQHDFNSIYEFDTQPNMVFNLDKNWKSKQDYINSFTKKI
uniref:hypothetical protein n=1 Tax=Flavobacterium sp. TaxID=239 RepID=UPI00404955A1